MRSFILLGILLATVVRISAQATSGTLWGMGNNSLSELINPGALNLTTPTQIATNVTDVAAGANFTLYIRADATLWSMGQNNFGQLGRTANPSTPMQVATGVARVAAGYSHSLFLRTDATLWAMGVRNGIVDGSQTTLANPVQVATGVRSMAGGAGSTLFVKLDGTLWGMGSNEYGELGDGTTTPRPTPIQITTGVSMVAASQGFRHSLFVTTSGALWAMGDNRSGQLGDGTTTTRTLPVQVATNVTATAAGHMVSYFLKADGTLWGMGDNANGQLGDGTTIGRTLPVQIATGVSAMAAGGHYLLFQRNDGSLWGTGANGTGQLGDPSTYGTSRNTPVRIVASGVTRVTAGDTHALFIQAAAAVVAPTISSQPTSQSTAVGAPTNFSVTATGTAPLTYQWQRNGTNISGATNSTYVITASQSTDAGNYSVIVTNSAGTVTSAIATLTVTAAPTIATQPTNQSVVAGSNVTFTVVANGTAPLTYQWRRAGTIIPGATNSSFSIASATTGDAGAYSVVVSNATGTVTSTDAILSVNAAATPPVITTHPASQTVTAGNSFGLTVVATGTTPLSYQWRKGGVDIAGATATSYQVASAQLTDAGSYTVIVTNSAGSAMSLGATIVVNAGSTTPPAIVTQPANVSASPGTGATFFVAASGSAPLTYQWSYNGAAIAGATQAAYTTGAVQNSHAGIYSVVVRNSTGAVTSSGATLTVVASPTIRVAPINLVGYRAWVGQAFQFTLTGATTGSVWGTDFYSDDSSLADAAVHAGVLRAGETRVITVVALPGQPEYVGSIRNGVTSLRSGAGTGSFAFAGSGTFGSTAIAAPTLLPGFAANSSLVAGTRLIAPVLVTGGGAYSYQWHLNGVAIPGAVLNPYVIDFVNAANAGVYTVDITNALGTLRAMVGSFLVGPAGSPVITLQPADKIVFPGGALSLIVDALGSGNRFQWFRNGTALAGQTRAALLLPALTTADAGNYTATVSNSAGSYTTRAAAVTVSPEASRLINISCRTHVNAGQIVIPGFFIAGAGTKDVLIRAVGPGLGAFGLSGVMADPQIKVYQGSSEIAQNDNWDARAIGDAFGRLGAFTLPDGSRDAALRATLPAGQAYTVHVSGVGASSGIALIEVYDADLGESRSKLVNVSVRSGAGSGSSTLILGFVVRGTGRRNLLIRGVGPTLAAFGVSGTLPDPRLSLFEANGRLQLMNEGWSTGESAAALVQAATLVGAFALPDASRDAATISLIDPGLYTVQVASSASATGEALAEVYEIP